MGYIKIVTAVATATADETFFLLPTENLLEVVSTSTTNVRFYYGPMNTSHDGATTLNDLFAMDITMAAGETQAALDEYSVKAMQAAYVNPGNIPYLIPYGINGAAPTLATAQTKLEVGI
jgi:hypothetical protein